MIFVVLGMHKSGTTLVSQILHNSGINMVETSGEDISYDEGNKYERQSVLDLNMELLGARDCEVRDLPKPQGLDMTAAQQDRMRRIIADCNAEATNWGFKDPRSAYTYPLWRKELPNHRIIAIYRQPDEIWPRFRWQGLRKRYLNPLWAWQFLSRWMEHNLSLIEYLQSASSPYLLLDYREMMGTDTEINRLRAFVDAPIKDMRRTELYRTKRPRADLCLSFAGWLMPRVRGMSVKGVMQQLEDLRSVSGSTLTG